MSSLSRTYIVQFVKEEGHSCCKALEIRLRGRGRATKEDGCLSPELRAVAVPRRRRGPCGGRKIASIHAGTPLQPLSSQPEPQQPIADTLPAGSASRRNMAYREGGVASLRPGDRPT
ncbi:hypothetical protein NDU88_000741 [Pleurodeles waltl]|uniref:Uncharacterized protein n=1 Tax=Pleurodeles waltl TaxID=8319 RepID=A0AAV7MJR2_PLEWA|nr:hypothetical protein NDU88_000741 [Pleurodeles waltl]